MKIFLFSFLILTTCGKLYSQSCAQTLRLARSTYEQGRLHELPDLLASCIKNNGVNGFTKEQKVQAYTLLTMAYIYLEEPEKADEAMLNLLRTDPYFEPNPEVDPAEFIGLFNTFRTRPIYRLGVKFGINASQPNVSSYNPVSDGTGKYGYKISIGGGIAAEIPINDKLTIEANLLFIQKKFTNTSSSSLKDSTYSSSIGTENQSWISLPLVVQYQLFEERKGKEKRRILPFVEAGVCTDYLINATIDATQKRFGNQSSIDLKSFSITSQREKINVSAIIGAGFKTRIAGGYLLTDVRYSYGLMKSNSTSTLYGNQNLLFDYKIVDGVFTMNSLYFNVGYVQNFFNPKKLKRKR
jgi:hypothetical protein